MISPPYIAFWRRSAKLPGASIRPALTFNECSSSLLDVMRKGSSDRVLPALVEYSKIGSQSRTEEAFPIVSNSDYLTSMLMRFGGRLP